MMSMAASPPKVGGPGHCMVGASDSEASWPGPEKGWGSSGGSAPRSGFSAPDLVAAEMGTYSGIKPLYC